MGRESELSGMSVETAGLRCKLKDVGKCLFMNCFCDSSDGRFSCNSGVHVLWMAVAVEVGTGKKGQMQVTHITTHVHCTCTCPNAILHTRT